MGKRMIRVFNGQLAAQITQLLHRQLNVVLKSGHTIYGQLEKTENGLLFVRDARFHLHTLAVTQVEEIIYDQSAAF